jgi:hypothetical protein
MRNEREIVQMERGRKEEFREERKRDLESGKERGIDRRVTRGRT